jgi:outer membrane lipoprotein-sorting protein
MKRVAHVCSSPIRNGHTANPADAAKLEIEPKQCLENKIRALYITRRQGITPASHPPHGESARMKLLAALLVLFSVTLSVHGQQLDSESESDRFQITSVNDVKKLMEQAFESIQDYTADIVWVNGNVEYFGTISYKRENKFLIEFEEPEDQVIVSNGEYLYLYIPYLRIVVQQLLGEATESSLLATSSSQAGLSKMFNEYAFSFADSNGLQPFGSTMAYHLKLYQKRPKVGFKSMDLWVSKQGYILQSNGVSPSGVNVNLSFSNIQVNRELPDHIFEFEVPADAQIMQNIIVPFVEVQEEQEAP